MRCRFMFMYVFSRGICAHSVATSFIQLPTLSNLPIAKQNILSY